MQVFKKILVCLDGSKPAEKILPYVEAVALSFGSKVIFLEVVTVSRHDFSGVTSRTPSHETEMVEKQIQRAEVEAKDYLESIAQKLSAKGIEFECVVLNKPSIGNAVVKYAEDNEVDLIAMTTHGHGGWGHLISGSLADYVLKVSRRPTLVIKRGQRE